MIRRFFRLFSSFALFFFLLFFQGTVCILGFFPCLHLVSLFFQERPQPRRPHMLAFLIAQGISPHKRSYFASPAAKKELGGLWGQVKE
jgi:hypothetical protein